MIVWIPATTVTGGGKTYTAGTPYPIIDSVTPVTGNTYYCPWGLVYCGYADGYAGIGDEPYYAGLAINYFGVVVNGVAAPSRIAWDKTDDLLLIADTGNGRILAVGEEWFLNGQPQTITGNRDPIGSLPGQYGTHKAPWEIETTGDWHWPTQLPMAYDNEITWNPTPGNTEAPVGIAVDSQGDVFFSDANYGNVYELPHPADGNWNTANYEVNPANGGGCKNGSCSTETTFTWQPRGVFADQWGTVYAADAKYDNVLANLSRTATGAGGTGAVNFHQVPLNSPSYEWQQLEFNLNGATVGSVSAYTGGIENLDFNVTKAAVQGCYNGATGTCYLWVTFKPTAPGLRRGAVALYDQSGKQIANVPLFGLAAAPELEAFPTGYGTTIDTDSVATVQPMQIALDGANNLYVANYTGDSVVEVPPQGGSAQVIAGVQAGSPEQATGVAVDGAGNIYVADHQGQQIWVKSPSSAFYPLVIDGLSTPLSQPMELNFDAAGNLYIADSGNGRVVEVDSLYANGDGQMEGRGTVVMTTAPCFYLDGSNNCVAAGGYNLPAATGASGFQSVTGVAIDPWQNVYISDSKNSVLLVAPQSMNQINPGLAGAGRLNWPYVASSFTGVAGGFNLPNGLTTDGMGNLYVADAGNSRIVMGNLATEIGTTFGTHRDTGFGVTVSSYTKKPGALGGNLFGVVVDPNGNVFVPDNANNRIAAYYPTIAPTLNFAPTYVGATSVDSPQSFDMFNIGDETLDFQSPASGLNPSISANFKLDGSVNGACAQAGPTTTLVLAPDYGCSLNISFEPTVVGNISGSLTVTDDNLYPYPYTSSTIGWSTKTVSLTTGPGPGGLMDFAFATPNPASAVLNPGGTGTFTLPISPIGTSTFPLAVSFTIAGAPAGSSASLSPSSLNAGASATSMVLTVTAASLTASNNQPQSMGRKLAPIAFALLLLPVFGIRRARKTWQRYLAVLILVVGGLAATAGLSACSNAPSGYFGQGTTYDYTVHVTATSGGVSHSTDILITVN